MPTCRVQSESFNSVTRNPFDIRNREGWGGRSLVAQTGPRTVMPEMDHNNAYVPQTADSMTQTSVTPLAAEAGQFCKALIASSRAFP